MHSYRRVSPEPPTSTSKVDWYGAVIFLTGCLVLVANAVLTIYALAKPGFQPSQQYVYAQGALSLLSSTLFVTGGGFGIVYVVKHRHEEDTLVGVDPIGTDITDNIDLEKGPNCLVHDRVIPQSPNRPVNEEEKQYFLTRSNTVATVQRSRSGKVWWAICEVWRHYTGEIGFWTTIIFLSSSTIFLGASIASMVTIVTAGGIVRPIRYPQLVGSIGFAVASAMIMASAYKQAHALRPGKWWQLPWHHRRWYVGFGNFVGSVGFTICSIAGLIVGAEWSKDQFGISFVWGSWFFLFASALQWQRSRSKLASEEASAPVP